MRKCLLLLALSLTPALAFCQYFVLTPDGMMSTEPEPKSYIVLEFPGKSKAELFDMAKNYLVPALGSAKSTLNEAAPNALSVNAVLPFPLDGRLYIYDALLDYKYNLRFKDGRIRVDFALIRFRLAQPYEDPFPIGLVPRDIGHAGIFRRNGAVSSDISKEAIERCANRLTAGLVDAVNGAPEEEW